jgi:uncharacterized protein YecE (DUF72 family)
MRPPMAFAHIGTSGFSYKEWKPFFYPKELSEKNFLSFYAAQFGAVEIDYTFYRMPTPKTLDAWSGSTPESFRFAIKASQKITHRERLAVPSEALSYLIDVTSRLGDRLGVILYQLPPFFKADLGRLEAFLAALPPKPSSVLEFRHASWFTNETYRLLEKYGVALCINDNDELEAPIELTAKFTYVRLRRDAYNDEQRDAWKERIVNWAKAGVDVFAFIKHKDNPRAPLIALDFAKGVATVPAASMAP